MRLVTAIIAVLIVFFASTCAYIVNEGQSAILVQFGRIVEAGVKPGLHFKLPAPLQQALRFDRRILTIESASTSTSSGVSRIRRRTTRRSEATRRARSNASRRSSRMDFARRSTRARCRKSSRARARI